ncbi:MAG: hypothetical protein HYY30_10530 [Chloroflexi bacterium]|nr:hypothetical protein [Chloroflexota bacterium]
MHSSLIGKIEKAKRYAEERDRITISQLKASFRGEHDVYEVSFEGGNWKCSCNFFGGWNVCSHTMAMQRVLCEMTPKECREQKPDLVTTTLNGR